MIDHEALAILKEALYVSDIEIGTSLNVLVYKAFVGEPTYPTIIGDVKSKAPFFECAHFEKVLVAPEPPYYSTNFNTLSFLIHAVLGNTIQIELYLEENREACVVLLDSRFVIMHAHTDMHVAGLQALVHAIEDAWPLPLEQ